MFIMCMDECHLDLACTQSSYFTLSVCNIKNDSKNICKIHSNCMSILEFEKVIVRTFL